MSRVYHLFNRNPLAAPIRSRVRMKQSECLNKDMHIANQHPFWPCLVVQWKNPHILPAWTEWLLTAQICKIIPTTVKKWHNQSLYLNNPLWWFMKQPADWSAPSWTSKRETYSTSYHPPFVTSAEFLTSDLERLNAITELGKLGFRAARGPGGTLPVAGCLGQNTVVKWHLLSALFRESRWVSREGEERHGVGGQEGT